MEEVEKQVKQVIVDKLGVVDSDITCESDYIADLGADSLDMVELIMEMEERFGVKISDNEAEGMRTVGDTVAFLKDKISLS
ncbi:MAG: acyl carrier protein [Bacteroidales bacterium]|nr:acyl carrier protein [Bacteroidales bacterium]